MLEESHLGHLNFWMSVGVGLAIVVEFVAALVVVVVVEEEGDGEGEGSKTTPEMGRLFRSRFRRPEAPPPNSSWIIFTFLDLKITLKKERNKKKRRKNNFKVGFVVF